MCRDGNGRCMIALRALRSQPRQGISTQLGYIDNDDIRLLGALPGWPGIQACRLQYALDE